MQPDALRPLEDFIAPGKGFEITDPSKAWPETRQEATIGTLAMKRAEPQASGPCRDLNFDPLILPVGIAGCRSKA